jgi:putative flippase GtrA
MNISNTNFFRSATLRFISVGIFGAILELMLFSTLMNVGLGILSSNFIAFHCAFILCFFLHYYYTHHKPYVGKRMIAGAFFQYTFLMYMQLVIGTFLLWLLIDKLAWVAEIAKVVQIGIVTPLSYVVQKRIVFRAKRTSN